MRVFVSPFTVKGEQGKDVESIFRERLVSSKRFNVLFQPSHKDPVDMDEALGLAKEAEAEFLLMGKVDADRESLEMETQLIEISTENEVIELQDAYDRETGLKDNEENCRILVEDIIDELPLLEGEIRNIRQDRVMINHGKKSNVKVGMRLIFFREEESDIQTGYDFGSDVDVIGFGRIHKLNKRLSYAELLDKEIKSRLEKGCPVITK
ncbi:MAG: hypothetical protein GY795_45805 [Desulfobacterales bacterium]|nr:hypothetical protein [Desulfobacterales bacterium]